MTLGYKISCLYPNQSKIIKKTIRISGVNVNLEIAKFPFLYICLGDDSRNSNAF